VILKVNQHLKLAGRCGGGLGLIIHRHLTPIDISVVKNMAELIHTIEFDDYDTTINIIGGLRDCSVIYQAIESHFNDSDTLQGLISGRNELNLRTERSRKRVETAISRAILQFRNQDHKDLIKSLFQHNVSLPERELILFWQFSLNNRLFREISCKVFVKIYFSGRTGESFVEEQV